MVIHTVLLKTISGQRVAVKAPVTLGGLAEHVVQSLHFSRSSIKVKLQDTIWRLSDLIATHGELADLESVYRRLCRNSEVSSSTATVVVAQPSPASGTAPRAVSTTRASISSSSPPTTTANNNNNGTNGGTSRSSSVGVRDAGASGTKVTPPTTLRSTTATATTMTTTTSFTEGVSDTTSELSVMVFGVLERYTHKAANAASEAGVHRKWAKRQEATGGGADPTTGPTGVGIGGGGRDSTKGGGLTPPAGVISSGRIPVPPSSLQSMMEERRGQEQGGDELNIVGPIPYPLCPRGLNELLRLLVEETTTGTGTRIPLVFPLMAYYTQTMQYIIHYVHRDVDRLAEVMEQIARYNEELYAWIVDHPRLFLRLINEDGPTQTDSQRYALVLFARQVAQGNMELMPGRQEYLVEFGTSGERNVSNVQIDFTVNVPEDEEDEDDDDGGENGDDRHRDDHEVWEGGGNEETVLSYGPTYLTMPQSEDDMIQMLIGILEEETTESEELTETSDSDKDKDGSRSGSMGEENSMAAVAPGVKPSSNEAELVGGGGAQTSSTPSLATVPPAASAPKILFQSLARREMAMAPASPDDVPYLDFKASIGYVMTVLESNPVFWIADRKLYDLTHPRPTRAEWEEEEEEEEEGKRARDVVLGMKNKEKKNCTEKGGEDEEEARAPLPPIHEVRQDALAIIHSHHRIQEVAVQLIQELGKSLTRCQTATPTPSFDWFVRMAEAFFCDAETFYQSLAKKIYYPTSARRPHPHPLRASLHSTFEGSWRDSVDAYAFMAAVARLLVVDTAKNVRAATATEATNPFAENASRPTSSSGGKSKRFGAIRQLSSTTGAGAGAAAEHSPLMEASARWLSEHGVRSLMEQLTRVAEEQNSAVVLYSRHRHGSIRYPDQVLLPKVRSDSDDDDNVDDDDDDVEKMKNDVEEFVKDEEDYGVRTTVYVVNGGVNGGSASIQMKTLPFSPLLLGTQHDEMLACLIRLALSTTTATTTASPTETGDGSWASQTALVEQWHRLMRQHYQALVAPVESILPRDDTVNITDKEKKQPPSRNTPSFLYVVDARLGPSFLTTTEEEKALVPNVVSTTFSPARFFPSLMCDENGTLALEKWTTCAADHLWNIVIASEAPVQRAPPTAMTTTSASTTQDGGDTSAQKWSSLLISATDVPPAWLQSGDLQLQLVFHQQNVLSQYRANTLQRMVIFHEEAPRPPLRCSSSSSFSSTTGTTTGAVVLPPLSNTSSPSCLRAGGGGGLGRGASGRGANANTAGIADEMSTSCKSKNHNSGSGRAARRTAPSPVLGDLHVVDEFLQPEVAFGSLREFLKLQAIMDFDEGKGCKEVEKNVGATTCISSSSTSTSTSSSSSNALLCQRALEFLAFSQQHNTFHATLVHNLPFFVSPSSERGGEGGWGVGLSSCAGEDFFQAFYTYLVRHRTTGLATAVRDVLLERVRRYHAPWAVMEASLMDFGGPLLSLPLLQRGSLEEAAAAIAARHDGQFVDDNGVDDLFEMMVNHLLTTQPVGETAVLDDLIDFLETNRPQAQEVVDEHRHVGQRASVVGSSNAAATLDSGTEKNKPQKERKVVKKNPYALAAPVPVVREPLLNAHHQASPRTTNTNNDSNSRNHSHYTNSGNPKNRDGEGGEAPQQP